MSQNAMTANEKALLQAKHRVEEVEARNRVKERKARSDPRRNLSAATGSAGVAKNGDLPHLNIKKLRLTGGKSNINTKSGKRSIYGSVRSRAIWV